MNNVEVLQSELDALKTRAQMLNVRFHPSISLEKLREKVNAAVEGRSLPEDGETAAADGAASAKPESENALRLRLQQEAGSLVRVIVTCNNPAKKEWEGEIFTVGNRYVGTFSKFVPFDNEEGWHVPQIILNMIKERQCQTFSDVRDTRGNTTRKSKLIKEFNIEVLDNLTPEQIKELARRQAMARGETA